MSDSGSGEKTEQASQKRIDDAFKQGQFPRSNEIQTLFVTAAGGSAIFIMGGRIWREMGAAMSGIFSDLHTIEVQSHMMGDYIMVSATFFMSLVGPIVFAAMGGGILAGILQTKFRITPEVLGLKPEKLSPASGWKKLADPKNLVVVVFSLLKISCLGGVIYGEIAKALQSPIFTTIVSTQDFLLFLARTTAMILIKTLIVMLVLSILDYLYQSWKTSKSLMMSKTDQKEETKSLMGNQQIKGKQRSMQLSMGQRKMMNEVPTADVVVTNPTHFAVALKYDRGKMQAPKIVAKGTRLIAQRIKKIAQENKVPIIENKPLARMLYKVGKVGGEIPASLYAAVAEILAIVYRQNPYRYHRLRLERDRDSAK